MYLAGLTDTARTVERVFREEHGRVLASLIRVLGDFDLAEDSLSDALSRALELWPAQGVPERPAAWITTTARNRAIDRLRHDRMRRDKAGALRRLTELRTDAAAEPSAVGEFPDERLRLVFTCCHPALDRASQVALTLRTLGGLTTPEIARAFLVNETTMAQRIVRVKRKIRDAAIPYAVPDPERLASRTAAVLEVVYLVFNEGYAATAGDALVRRELCEEAIRLARLLVQLLPGDTEVEGLLALMLLHDARRDARTDADGQLLTLENQDRALWNRERITEGVAILDHALARGSAGPYQIQAAVSALHNQATEAAETDWSQIAGLYGALLRLRPSPVVALNRAVAVAMADGPERGLALLETLAADPRLQAYQPFYAARADLLRRAGRPTDAAPDYRRALALTQNATERAYLAGRLASCTTPLAEQHAGRVVAGRVESVHVGPSHEFSKCEVPEIELVAGRGVAGDAHCGETVKHRSRVARDPTQPNLRQVHLLHAELFDELAAKGFTIADGQIGENITTRGLQLLALPTGAELHIGATAVVRVTGLRNPCAQLDALQHGLMAAVLDRTPAGELVRKSGVMGVVVTAGTVSAGDAIRVEQPAGPHRPLERV